MRMAHGFMACCWHDANVVISFYWYSIIIFLFSIAVISSRIISIHPDSWFTWFFIFHFAFSMLISSSSSFFYFSFCSSIYFESSFICVRIICHFVLTVNMPRDKLFIEEERRRRRWANTCTEIFNMWCMKAHMIRKLQFEKQIYINKFTKYQTIWNTIAVTAY